MPIDYPYINQPLPVKWVTTADMTSVTVVQIKYTKPSGVSGFVTLSTTATAGTYTGLLPGANVNETGQWQFRAWLTVSYDVNPLPGRIHHVIIHDLDEEQ